MISHCPRFVIVLCGLLTMSACAYTGPTEPEINESLTRSTEDAVQSAAGPWVGQVLGGILRVDFSVAQAPDGRLEGSGTMREGQVAAVPITVSGTYRRPNLSLTFTGMVFEGREVVGTFEGTYNSFTGITSTLRLAAEGYSRSLSLWLSESTLGSASPSPILGGADNGRRDRSNRSIGPVTTPSPHPLENQQKADVW